MTSANSTSTPTPRPIHRLVVGLVTAVSLLASFSNASTTVNSNGDTMRSFSFDIVSRYAALRSTLPSHTAIYNEYPRSELRCDLPDYLTVAAMKEVEVGESESTDTTGGSSSSSSSSSSVIESSSYVLMGRPIHVMQNEILSLEINNKLPSTGLSIHFHGFEMANKVEYDGVVGLTQCPISPETKFKYEFKVEEEPGTYWYHTHSGNLGVDSHNYIKGPLIVYPNTVHHELIVNTLNNHQLGTTSSTTVQRSDSSSKHSKPIINYGPLLAHLNERILFISDGALKSGHETELYYVGGLNPPVQTNDDDFVAAAIPWEYGTLNGKLRDVIHVEKGQKYTFRIINGGNHFAFRFSIDGINEFTILNADSTPVIYNSNDYGGKIVNELILHNAERFDIEISIPSEIPNGSRFWIRMDTLESRKMGYQNGIRGILHVVDDINSTVNMHDDDILDPMNDVLGPAEHITHGPVKVEERVTLNCYSHVEKEAAEENGIGGCLPITVLKAKNYHNPHSAYHDRERGLEVQEAQGEQGLLNRDTQSILRHPDYQVRTVDFTYSPPPFHAHFVRIDDGNWYQHVGASTHMLDSDYDASKHKHTAIMDVPSFSSVIIIWRSESPMDHPMHLHGYKMEILEVFAAHRVSDCSLTKCTLSNIFNSTEKMDELKEIPVGTRPIKDTFIMPSGGAVATRIFTREPAPWLAHCHMEVHAEDGMAFVLNVGNYVAPKNDSWLPNDFPDCETPFLQSHDHYQTNCNCYINKDAVLDMTMDETFKCSRSYLCWHEQGQVAELTKLNDLGGFRIQSSSSFPGWAISLIIVGIVALITVFLVSVFDRCMLKHKPELVRTFKMSVVRFSMKSIRQSSVSPSFLDQFRGLAYSQWSEYRPGTVNVLRVIEVGGLGILGGILFQDVGNNQTATGFGEKTSLLFFSTTLWSQTRMYPAIGNYFEWSRKDYLTFKHKQYDLLPVCLSRMVVVNLCEAWWPFLFVMCAFPLAAMFGIIGVVFTAGFVLALNNMCYIALGGVFGTVMPTVSLGIIGATLFAQTTVICAGFFTQLPGLVSWIRYISPIYYTFKAIVKLAYNWDDTYECPKGSSNIGPNQCYLEQSAAIDDYKQRGINVATFGDPKSDRVYVEILMLVVLFVIFQLIMILYHVILKIIKLRNEDDDVAELTQEDLDEKYDEKIIEMGRASIFLKVDEDMATSRQSIRQSIRQSTRQPDRSNNFQFNSGHNNYFGSQLQSSLLEKRDINTTNSGEQAIRDSRTDLSGLSRTILKKSHLNKQVINKQVSFKTYKKEYGDEEENGGGKGSFTARSVESINLEEFPGAPPSPNHGEYDTEDDGSFRKRAGSGLDSIDEAADG